MGRPVDLCGSAVLQQQQQQQKQQCHSPQSPAVATVHHGCSLEALRGDVADNSALVDTTGGATGWEGVPGLDAQQLEALQKVASRGVFWQHPTLPVCRLFALHYGGDVEADGNCLFTAVKRAMLLKETPSEIRLRTVRRFADEYEASTAERKEEVDRVIRNLYSPNLSAGWGVHVVQEVKLLANKADRSALAIEMEDLMQAGMSRDLASESVFKERCIHVNDGRSWSKYMSVSGQSSDEHDIVTLLYTEEGLLSVESNPDGRAAAFGDDIAIAALASEFQRQVFVVQAHGRDVIADTSEGLLFFLPHNPQQQSSHFPVFLLMRGTGWCGAGGDHYEPVLAKPLPMASKEKAAIVL